MARLDFQDMEKSYTFKVGQRTKRKFLNLLQESKEKHNKSSKREKLNGIEL